MADQSAKRVVVEALRSRMTRRRPGEQYPDDKQADNVQGAPLVSIGASPTLREARCPPVADTETELIHARIMVTIAPNLDYIKRKSYPMWYEPEQSTSFHPGMGLSERISGK